MTEEEILDYIDVMADLGSCIQKYGARKVMLDFQKNYPDLFQELKTQITRYDDKPKAALLKKPNADSV